MTCTPTPSLALFGAIGPWEVIALLAVGLLIFGKRLPEVGRSLGKGVIEFKKGLSGIEDEVDKAGKSEPTDPAGPDKTKPAPTDAHEQAGGANQHTTGSP